MKTNLERTSIAVVILGLTVRVLLAPISGHPYDMGLFALSQRLYFESGILDLKYFPTLPLLFYVQIPFYAFYTLLRDLGLPDFQLFYHTTLMVESVFLKLPLILSDLGGFFAIRALTGRRMPAILFFLNPFVIYLSSVWGTYDTLMMFPLVAGFALLLSHGKSRSTVAFVVSGLAKLFGFLPYVFLVLDSFLKRQFRLAGLQIIAGLAISIGLLLPTFLVGGFNIFLLSIPLRFLGINSTASTTSAHSYNLLYNVFGQAFAQTRYFEVIAVGMVLSAYGLESRRLRGAAKVENITVLVKWSLVGAIALNIFSPSEPQWLSWIIPLGIIYGFLTNRTGLQHFTFFYGAIATFLIITLGQGTGYVLGTSLHFLSNLEVPLANNLALYALCALSLLIIALGYVFLRPVRFKLEIAALMTLIYLQGYFWFVIVGIHNL